MTGKYIALDTNLALLLVVGITNTSYIARHKRLAAYDVTDFKIVAEIIASSRGVLFTPNVLSETSNMIGYVNDPIRSEIRERFADMIKRGFENYVPSRVAADRAEFIRLGLTDSALLSQHEAILLTDDLPLALAALTAGQEAINYNHIREKRPDFR